MSKGLEAGVLWSGYRTPPRGPTFEPQMSKRAQSLYPSRGRKSKQIFISHHLWRSRKGEKSTLHHVELLHVTVVKPVDDAVDLVARAVSPGTTLFQRPGVDWTAQLGHMTTSISRRHSGARWTTVEVPQV